MKTKSNTTRKLALAGILTAVAVVGSLISVPVAGSKCAPVQHMVNVFAAVVLGPWWGVAIAFCASLLRNLLGIGSLMAFPGSMVGALCCGLVYHFSKRISLTCVAEALGTGVLGGLCAYPVATLFMSVDAATTAVTAYIIPFFISTFVGSLIAGALVFALQAGGALKRMQRTLDPNANNA